jgi:multiple sugar transport system permease protein
MYTITVGISIVTQGAYVNLYGPLMAFSTVAAVPTVILFIILQRYFVASATLSGVKG